MRRIGVLAGMGPAAGADFLGRLVSAHPAARDQDHPECILYSATSVPDRTAFLLGGEADPTPALVEAVRCLERAGADFIVVPCNSAHAFLGSMREAVDLPVLDMIGIAVAATRSRARSASRIGLLAASGTLKVGLYERPLREAGLVSITPSAGLQEEVMEAIREIKAEGGRHEDHPALVDAAARLVDAGAEAILMGCTEVPLGLAPDSCPVPAVDANQALAEAALAYALGVEPAEGAGVEPAGRAGDDPASRS